MPWKERTQTAPTLISFVSFIYKNISGSTSNAVTQRLKSSSQLSVVTKTDLKNMNWSFFPLFILFRAAFNVIHSTGMRLLKPALLHQCPRERSLSTAMIPLLLILLCLGRRVSDRYLGQNPFNDAAKVSCKSIHLKAQINLQCKNTPVLTASPTKGTFRAPQNKHKSGSWI